MFKAILQKLAEDPRQRGGIDPSKEAFIDGSFAGARKGSCVGKTKRGKGTKIMAITDSNGLPVSICTTSASPHEVTLVEETLDASFVEESHLDSLATKPMTVTSSMSDWLRNETSR